MRVGVFDSGMGGLTVLKSLIDKYPNNHYIYFGDTKNLPYGNKSKDKLMELSKNIINFLIENNYNEDGSINIPKVLRPYMGGKEKIEPSK